MNSNNPPAFPHSALASTGMTLRDYFAAKAMQGLLACGEAHCDGTNSVTADAAYAMADAMLAERAK